jgi:hypothetical protein
MTYIDPVKGCEIVKSLTPRGRVLLGQVVVCNPQSCFIVLCSDRHIDIVGEPG